MSNRANVFWFTDNTLNTRITVADGDYFTGNLPIEYLRGNCYLRFLDANGDLVTPTAGTISFVASPIEGQFLMAPAVTSIDATTVGGTPGSDATYTPPTFDSIAIGTRMTLTGVTGAAFVEAWHWRSQ
tara:strand:- start:9830 stop:10213 length:384 start_codon:yes stop_codon:yes gene_type:complete